MNRSRQDIEITEATVFDEGNNRFMNAVNPDLHAITLGLGAYHGWKQNGAQIDPDNPPANIAILKPDGWRLRFDGPDCVRYRKGVLPAYEKINAALFVRGGSDGEAAWIIFVDTIHESAPFIEWADFKVAFKAASIGNLMEITEFVAALKPSLPVGWEWKDIRDWVNSKSREALLGGKTEILEVIS